MLLDKILDFLFRSRLGRLTLLVSVMMSSLIFGGCFIFDMAGCFCAGLGCEVCADCWDECNDGCDEMFNCMDCAVCDCLFGDGCVSECGSCGYLSCGGLNRTIFTECGLGCSGDGCGNCESSCGNCSIGCGNYDGEHGGGGCGGSSCNDNRNKEPKYKYYGIDIEYIDQATGSVVDTAYYSFREDWSVTSVPLWHEKEYYDFLGYYLSYDKETNEFSDQCTDAAGNWTSSTDIKGDRKIYGKVQEKYFGEARTFTFRAEPAEVDVYIPNYTAVVGQAFIGVPEAPSVAGYTFSHWVNENGKEIKESAFRDGAVFHLSNFGVAESPVITLTAVYVPVMYEVTFVVDGKSYVISNVKYSTQFSQAESLLKQNNPELLYDDQDENGRKIVGWSLEQDVRYDDTYKIISDNYLIGDNVTFYAVTRHYYLLVLFNYYGIDDERYLGGNFLEGELLELPIPDPVGRYEFDGWFYDQNIYAGKQIVMPSEDIYLFAHWRSVDQYTIEYYVNGVFSYRQTYTYNATGEIELLTSVEERRGYTFAGWCEDSNLSDPPKTRLPAGAFGNKKLYAKYEPKTYNVMLVASPGSFSNGNTIITENVTYDSTYRLTVPTRKGYSFQGWYYVKPDNTQVQCTDGTGASLNIFSEVYLGTIDGDTVQLIARWAIQQLTVKFYVRDDSGAKLYAEASCDYGQPLGTPEALNTDPAKRGHTFRGWFSNGKKFDPNASVTEDCEYYAEFDLKEYTITLNADGGTINGSETIKVTIKFGQKLTLSIPQRAGYTFMGWYDQSGRPITYADGIMLISYDWDDDIVLTARWIEN